MTTHRFTARAMVVGLLASGGCRADNLRARTATHIGDSAAAFERQHPLEELFRRSVSSERLAGFHAALTARPPIAGTPASLAEADNIRRTLESFGLADARKGR